MNQRFRIIIQPLDRIFTKHVRYLIVLLPLVVFVSLGVIYQSSNSKEPDRPSSDKASGSASFSTQLRDRCPPGFELTDSNTCECRHMYQQYKNLQGAGVGGLQAGLPEARDGFSPQQIDLGRLLFFDPVLSADSSTSCASCHKPEKGFSDGRGRSMGMHEKPLQRGAPSLWNVAFKKSFFWDGRASTLEEQMQEALFNGDEMGNTKDSLLAALNNDQAYQLLFNEAYPENHGGQITLEEVYTALTAFQTSLISLNSRYDQYAHGNHNALSEREIKGLNVFRSSVARCAECHTPPLFTNRQIAVIGAPAADGAPFDEGAQATFGDSSLRGGFKVPTLRNIAKTAPYMHSGAFTTLEGAIRFYNKGRGHAVPEGENLDLHWLIHNPDLKDKEVKQLVDFLKTLTDQRFKPQVPEQLPSGLPLVHKHKRSS
ncbi:MAG: cytochrome-c peroxidase [Bacteroidetes bacterium SW_11_45_7]|nr:MAG: cytochrome-c peroxidase [Bacteroidetes bacterium SW_11_45_7]